MMPKAIRHSAIVSTIIAIALLLAPARSWADAAIDTSKLPRVSGTKEIYASPQSTIFTAPTPVADTAANTLKALNAEGWQQYDRISASTPENASMVIASLKKGAQGLSVFINVAPAQNNATSVTYSLVPLTNDLPFPSTASDIKFDPETPHLKCMTTDGVEAVSEFFRTELISRGWSPWSKEDGTTAAYADRKTPNGLYAYYVRDDKKPLILTLQKSDDGKTAVNLEAIPRDLIVATKKIEEPKPEAATAPEAKPADKAPDAFDDLTNDIMNQVRKATSDALAGRSPAPPKSEQSDQPPQAPLTALADNSVPIPLPSNAENVAYDAGAANLDFNSVSSVAAIVAFYRASMPPLGWTERKTVINQPNMVALEFHKGEQEVSLTVMKMGTSVNVTATGSALENRTAAPAESTQPAPGGDSETTQALELDDAGGLPIPKPHSLIGSEKSMFRRGANGSVPAKLTDVVEFYRVELAKRGWQEDTAKAIIKPDAAEFFYTTPDGPAVLKLGRGNGETSILLSVRETEAAKKSGLMPKSGQTKLLFGNILDSTATVAIAGKTIKIPGGAGSKGPDGPMLEVAPGKYPFSLKGSKAPMANDTIEVAADEIWGLMIGPGGVLPIQMY